MTWRAIAKSARPYRAPQAPARARRHSMHDAVAHLHARAQRLEALQVEVHRPGADAQGLASIARHVIKRFVSPRFLS